MGGDEIETQERGKTKKAETGERERVDIKTMKQKKKQEELRRKEMRKVEDEKKIRNAQICKELERKRERVGIMENMMKKEKREREREIFRGGEMREE